MNTPTPPINRTKGRLFLLLLAALCGLPLALSYGFYYIWKPQRTMNYGELLDMRTLPPLPGASGPPGRWVLLQIDSADCNAGCQRSLYEMRQSRLAMGIKKDKLAVVWLIAGGGTPAPQLLDGYREVNVQPVDPAFQQRLPEPNRGRIFLIDPAGRLVLRYPEQPDAERLIRDLARLLDVKRM